ncbi:MAG: hypothetical protein IPG75_20795 [Gemmatimonadetes bacterium]|nr:hypothetical protein [Gemmatimonadota bacterium]
MEAIQQLPRRLVLYVTRPEVAEEWSQRLFLRGFKRIGCITGKTSTSGRRDALRAWECGDTHVMVATAAFGLGVDQQDVRAVVHATLPESVDRFYQEVGRGGRDGRASLSLVVTTPDDFRQANRLGRKTLIGLARGRERWTRMYCEAKDLGGGRILLPVDAVPSNRDGDIDMDNQLNREWNSRTLTLMARAGILALDSETPEEAEANNQSELSGTAATTGGSVRLRVRRRVVRMLVDGASTAEAWDQLVAPIRKRATERDNRDIALLEELHGPGPARRCHAEILAEAYGIAERVEPQRNGCSVALACGGCRYCRQMGFPPRAGFLPRISANWSTPLAGRRTGEGAGVARMIFYEPEGLEDAVLRRFVRWSIGQGTRILVTSPVVRERLSSELLGGLNAGRWVFTYDLESFSIRKAPALATLVIAGLTDHLPEKLPPPSDGMEEESKSRGRADSSGANADTRSC